MPIIGLSDQEKPTFPKIADIRKGAEKGKRRPGRDLTYFRYVAIEGEEKAAEVFAQHYGTEPREINIFLPFDDIDRNFEAWMERHTAGALQCRGDGETCHLWRDENGKMHREERPCGELEVCEKCRPNGRLKVIIPELRRLAYITVHTTSKWDIVELTGNLRALQKLTDDSVKGIPLVLKRRPREISTPRKGGKRVRQTKWLLSIEADQHWVDQQMRYLEKSAMPSAPQLESGKEVDERDVRLLSGEVVEAGSDEAVPEETVSEQADAKAERAKAAIDETLAEMDEDEAVSKVEDVEETEAETEAEPEEEKKWTHSEVLDARIRFRDIKFDATYDEVMKPTDGKKIAFNYLWYLRDLAADIRYENDKHFSNLVNLLFDVDKLTQATVGQWLILENYLTFIQDADDEEKARNAGKRIAKEAVRRQMRFDDAAQTIDWGTDEEKEPTR